MPVSEAQIYKRLKLLGEGSFGKAFLVECVRDRTFCVIKQMDLQFMTEAEKQVNSIEAYKEARILSHLKHPNIINFREVYKTKKSKLCIVMDYADDGDLAQKIASYQDLSYIPEQQILDWFTQLCLAVKHCHDRKIIHRDIKAQNIFMTKDNRIKLGDFGIAKVLNNTREKAKTLIGTPYYLAPEIIENKPYSFKGDIWSMGIVLYEMCKKKQPFDADSLHLLALKIVKGTFEAIPSFYSKDLRKQFAPISFLSLVNSILTVNSDRRPSVYQILKLPIVTNRIKKFLSETLKQQEFSHTILHNQNILLNNQPFAPFTNDVITPKQVLNNIKRIAQASSIQNQKPISPSVFPEIKKDGVQLQQNLQTPQQKNRVDTPKIDVKNSKIRKYSEELESQLKLPEIKHVQPQIPINLKEKIEPPKPGDPQQKIKTESRFLIRSQKKDVQSKTKFLSESPQASEQVSDKKFIHKEILPQLNDNLSPKQEYKSDGNDQKESKNISKIRIHLNQQLIEKLLKKKVVSAQPQAQEVFKKENDRQSKKEVQNVNILPQLPPEINLQTKLEFLEKNELIVPTEVQIQFLQSSLQRISEVSENKSMSVSITGAEEDTIQSLYLKSQQSYKDVELREPEIFNKGSSEKPLTQSLVVQTNEKNFEPKDQETLGDVAIIEGLSYSQIIPTQRIKKLSDNSHKSDMSDKSTDKELQKPLPTEAKELKKSDKKTKIIYRDPFRQKQQRKTDSLSQNSKNSLKRQESDEELKTFLTELQCVINQTESKEEVKEQKQEINYITNGDESYDEDDSVFEIQQGVPPSKIFIQDEESRHTLDYITGTKEIKVLNKFFYVKHLKDQLSFRLGKNFDQIYKIAKELSLQNEDLGCNDLKKQIQRILPHIEENVVNGIATLMITLVVINKGESISTQGILNY